jgi:hypothetical protein
MSFSTSIDLFLTTPIGLIVAGTVFFCWAHVYTIKHAKQAYEDLRIWAKISLSERNGEQRTLTLRHRMMRWSNGKKNQPGLRDFFPSVLQILGLLQQHASQDQPVSSTAIARSA